MKMVTLLSLVLVLTACAGIDRRQDRREDRRDDRRSETHTLQAPQSVAWHTPDLVWRRNG